MTPTPSHKTIRSKDSKELKPKKHVSLSSLKNKAWSVFSLWIRTRDADENGICTCVTCGKRAPIAEMDAGHGIGGRKNYLLFNEKLVNAQCKNCNIWRRGEYEKYAVILIKRHGLQWYEEMTKYREKIFTPKELEGIIKKYEL